MIVDRRDDLEAVPFVERGCLEGERHQHDLRAAASPGLLLGGLEQLCAESAATLRLLHPELAQLTGAAPRVPADPRHDAFALVRSAAPILREAERANGGPLDPRYPVFQVGSYDQTLPFYLGRATSLVEFRDEMSLGLDAEPEKGYNLARWFDAWFNAPQAYALMTRDTVAALARENVPFRVLAEDPRRAFIARR